MQIGYGGIPDAVVMLLTHKHDLAVHTDMLGDGTLSVIERGVVTQRRKTWMPGQWIATFALGWRDGKTIIVLPSTAVNGTVSRIFPTLAPGTHVSTSKNDVNYVVTEHGIAQLRGKPASQRAAALIAIAHPDFRSELTSQARRLVRP